MKSGFLTLLAVLGVGRLLASSEDTPACDFYLAPSTLPGAGRGIISGNTYKVGETVEITMSIIFRHDVIRYTQLNNYVFGYDSDWSMIIFGGGVLYNHMSELTVKHHWYTEEADLVHPSHQHFPYTPANDIQFIARIPVVPGQEMYSNYGTNWFVERGLVEQDVHEGGEKAATNQLAEATLVSIEDLERYGHCLTHVELKNSNIVFAGKGLFAKKSYKAGELVYVAPVLTLPKTIVDSSYDTSVLINFCFTLPGNKTEVTLFPLNNAVAMNHAPAGQSNVAFNWYDWTSIPSEGSYYEHLVGNALSLSEKLKMTPEEMFAAPFAQFDIGFTALRDIEAGEELLYDYGDSWGTAWNEYVEELKVWETEQKSKQSTTIDVDGTMQGIDMATMPPFRAYIGIPEGMFPAHWLRE